MESLTIVIPTTGRDSLRHAVWSAQQVADQVIVVADGCTIDWHCDADLIIEADAGQPGTARNEAIPYVTSEWVGFLDDDDELVPGVYRESIDELDGADVVVLTMDDPDLGLVPRPGLPIFHGNIGISFALRSDIWRAQPFIAGPPLTMRGEDYELVRRLMDKHYTVAITEAVGYRVLPQEAR